jgi:hypothetical protein
MKLQGNPKRVEQGERLAQLTGWLALFEITNEPQSCSRGHCQISLGHPESLASGLHCGPDVFWSVFHKNRIFPIGSISQNMQRCKLLSSRSGIQVPKHTHQGEIIPDREQPPPNRCSRSGATMVFFSFKVRGMNTPQNPENDIHYADTRHPVEHIEPLPQDGDNSTQSL